MKGPSAIRPDEKAGPGEMIGGPGEEKTLLQGEMLYNRLRKRRRHLQKWARRTGNEAFRLYDRDIPEIPLVLDWYGDVVSGALYRRPYEKDQGEEAWWLEVMRDAAARALEIPADRCYLKERGRQRGNAQYQKLGSHRISRIIREGGLRFQVNLSDYLDTGLFPDRRLLRNRLRSEARGKRVLNLFCYTAASSVYAAAGGAERVDSVDLSNTYLDWGADNFALNGLEVRRTTPEDLGLRPPPRGKHSGAPGDRPARQTYRLIRDDALGFIRDARRARLTWDLVLLDPPAFSNSKKMTDTLDVRRDARELVDHCLALLNPGGILYFSAPPRNFHLTPEEFPEIAMEDITEQIRDEDFRGKHIPPCYRFVH